MKTQLLAIVILLAGATIADANCTHKPLVGENLTRIAQGHGVTLKQMKEANAWLKARPRGYDEIYTTDILTIPEKRCQRQTPIAAIAQADIQPVPFPREYPDILNANSASGAPPGFYATQSQLENLEGKLSAWQKVLEERMGTLWGITDKYRDRILVLEQEKQELISRLTALEKAPQQVQKSTKTEQKTPEPPIVEVATTAALLLLLLKMIGKIFRWIWHSWIWHNKSFLYLYISNAVGTIREPSTETS